MAASRRHSVGHARQRGQDDHSVGKARLGDGRRAAATVVVGLAFTALGVVVTDLVNPQWNWMSTMASHYVNGRLGWIIPAALVIYGSAAIAVALRLPARSGGLRVGRLLIGALGVAVVVAGVFPADPPGQWDQPQSTSSMVHGVFGLGSFLIMPVVAVLVTASLPGLAVRSRSPLWMMAGLTVLAAIAFWVTLVDVLDGPSIMIDSHSIVGITERILLWAHLGWLAAVVLCVRRAYRSAA